MLQRMREPMTASDDQIRALWTAMERGWSDGDAAAFAAVFAEDCDFTTVRGEKPPGRTGIALGHDRLFRTTYRATRLEVDIRSIRYLSPDIAVVNAASAVVSHDGTDLVGTHALAVVAHTPTGQGGSAWQIAIFHNMVPVSAASNAPAPRPEKEL